MWIYKKLFELKQKEIKLVKDTKGFNYSYATLNQIQEKLNPLFKELNLILINRIENDEVITQIRDLEDDSYVESKILITKVETTREETWHDDKTKKDIKTIDYNEKDPQWVWSIITYYRRYNLLALLDLETEDDDWASWSNRAKAKTYSRNTQEYTCDKCWVVEAPNSTYPDKYWQAKISKKVYKCNACWKYSSCDNPVITDQQKEQAKKDELEFKPF